MARKPRRKGVPDAQRPARLHGPRVHLDEGLPRADPPTALRQREHPADPLHRWHAGDHRLNAGDHVGKRGGGWGQIIYRLSGCSVLFALKKC